MPGSYVEILNETVQNVTVLNAIEVVQPVDHHLNPIFDYSPLFGWPLWAFILIAFAMVFAAIHIKWFGRRSVMTPVNNYRSALASGMHEDMQTWIMGKNKSFFIEHLKYHDDGVISYRNISPKISMWFLRSSQAVGYAGGIKSCIVSDNYDTVRDPIAEAALCHVIEEHNAINPKKKDGQDAIINYDDYETNRKLLESSHPEGVSIDAYSHYDPGKAEKFMPPNRGAGVFGGDCIREARKMNLDEKEESDLIKFAPLGIAALIGIVAILFTYMMTSGGG